MAACRNGSARAAPTETGEPAPPQPVAFRPDYRAARLRGIGDVLAQRDVAGRTGAGRARRRAASPARCRSRAPACAAATFPGSASLPYTDLLNADGTFRSADAVRARLAQAGVDGIASGGDELRLRRDGVHPDARACASPGCRRARSTTAPGPNGAAAPTRRWRRSRCMTDTPKRGFRTRLSHTGRAGKRMHGFVNPPLLRGSTVLYPTVADRRATAGEARRARADLRSGRIADALGAGGRDRRGRGRHALRHRLLRAWPR